MDKKMIDELKDKAIEMLENDDELFIDAVNELDSWDGFADGYRGYPMDELDDLFCGTKVSDFIYMLTDDFDKYDDYFIETIYGIDSTDDLAEYYRDNTDENQVLDELIEHYYDISIYDSDLDDLIEQIVEAEEEVEEEKEA